MASTRSDSRASVVIPTYNRVANLTTVVAPALADPATGEVVVVVDGSHDGSIELLESWAEQEPRLRPYFQENRGEAAARQFGITAATFDVVVLVDDDVELSPGVVGRHVLHHQDRERLLVVGYMPTVTPSRRRRGQVATFLYAQNYEDTCRLYEERPQEILTHLWAGNISFRRDDALEIGFTSSSSLRYHEDLRFGLLCHAAGWEAVFDRTLLASHAHSRNLSRFVEECRRSGSGRALLLSEFPAFRDVLDPLAPMTRSQRRIVLALTRRPLKRPVAHLLRWLSAVAGGMRAWFLEDLATRVLRQVELVDAYQRTLAA